MEAPERFAGHLSSENYHPRSSKHSDFLCEAILDDLLDNCPELRERGAKGELVAKLRHRQTIGYDEWVIDLALGEPTTAPRAPTAEQRIRQEAPAIIQIAIELKSVMTEHKKARKNRLRDLHAFHTHAHAYSSKTIAAGLVVVNASRYFWSPLRKESDITEHRNIARLTKEITDTYRSIKLIDSPAEGSGMEAMGIIVVEHDNLRLNPNPPPGAPAAQPPRLATTALALGAGDPLHYATMIRRICNAYRARF